MTTIVIIVILIIAIFYIIGAYYDNQRRQEVKRANKEYFEKCRKEKKESQRQASLLDAKYGTCTKSIKWWFDESTNLIRIYEDSKTIVIKNDAFSFSDILGVSYIDKIQNVEKIVTTQTDNANMVSRAVVGGLIAGEIGATIGAVTAKQQTVQDDNDVHDYVILININDLSNSLIELRIANNISQVNEIIATLNAVMSYNH